jgi:AraC family transcriptional regulator of adaptative response/methylated-DNA-[protein]-cysteine methyltransferase
MTLMPVRPWWKAALRRDPAFDGVFVFGVLTTGIYCRPSCPARRPLARNVRFFCSPDAAEREGFRACRRCRPTASLAARAVDYLRRHARERVTLERMARSLAVSPAHLQRIFTRELGISPRAYQRVLKFERFRKGTGARNGVASALYGAGFGSTSRLYEAARARLGMTPATYLKGGLGMKITYDIIDCALGRALIAATPLGICAVQFGESDRALAKALSDRYPRASIGRNPSLLRRAGRRLRRILEGKPLLASLPLDARATAFQARVWEELRAIPAGATRSYGEIARRIGRPGSARAVGRACASNPVAVLIPCHRAVGADGGLTGYRWGKGRKKKLLALECRPD